MLVGTDEGLISKLLLEVDPESFDSVAHGVGSLHTGKVLQELGVDSLLWWLLLERIVAVR